MTQEHTDKREILDPSQYNHKTKLKTNAVCPHYDNLNNGSNSSFLQKNKVIHRDSMDTPSTIKSLGITSISTDNVGTLGRDHQKKRISSNRNQSTKKTDVDSSIKKLNKLKEEIASKLNEVKGVLNKYENDNIEQINSKNEPVKFRFVRRVRRKSSLIDDNEKAQSSRVTKSADANDTSDKSKIDIIQSDESKSIKEITSTDIEKVQLEINTEISDSNTSSEANKHKNCEGNVKNDSAVIEDKNLSSKEYYKNVIKTPLAASKKNIVKRPKSNKASMIVENSKLQENRRSSIAITEPSSLKNSLNAIPLNERRLSDSIAIVSAVKNLDTAFLKEMESNDKSTESTNSCKEMNNLISVNRSVTSETIPSEKSDNGKETVKANSPISQVDVTNIIGMVDQAPKHFIENQENINLEWKLKPIYEASDVSNIPTNKAFEESSKPNPSVFLDIKTNYELPTTVLLDTPESLLLAAETLEPTEKLNSNPILNMSDSQQIKSRTEEELVTPENLVVTSANSGEKVDAPITVLTKEGSQNTGEELSILKDLISTSKSLDNAKPVDSVEAIANDISIQKQATPGKIIRRKTPKIRRETSKASFEIKSSTDDTTEKEETIESHKEEPPVIIEQLTEEPVKRKPKAKKRVIIRKIKRKLSKDDPFSQENIQENTPVAEISEKDIFDDEENIPDLNKEATPVQEKPIKTILKLREFKEGDVVRYGERFKKTGLRWKKATIIERITSISYKLNINGEEKTVHVGFLKRDNDRKVNFGGKEYLEIDYEQIEEEEEAERNYSIWDRT